MEFFVCDNSESSAAEDRDDIVSSEERDAQIFAKQMLQGRLFLGHFQEKRRVEQLEDYRDVIVVNNSEVGLIKDMEIVRQRLRNFYKRKYWIGITDPSYVGAPNGHCFWIESNKNPFGYYWYKIKTVQFRQKEIIVKLKVIRPMTDNDCVVNDKTKVLSEENNINIEVLYDNIKNKIKENLIWFFMEALTSNNIKHSITFISVLLATLATSTIYGLGFLMNYSIKLLREISVLIHVLTPFLISIVNLIGKVVGGFYILIAMLWRGQGPIPRQLGYQSNHPRAILPPLRYRNHQPLTIREVN